MSRVTTRARQIPDEMYFGTGDAVPAKLASARAAAREARLAENRARQCEVCDAATEAA